MEKTKKTMEKAVLSWPPTGIEILLTFTNCNCQGFYVTSSKTTRLRWLNRHLHYTAGIHFLHLDVFKLKKMPFIFCFLAIKMPTIWAGFWTSASHADVHRIFVVTACTRSSTSTTDQISHSAHTEKFIALLVNSCERCFFFFFLT